MNKTHLIWGSIHVIDIQKKKYWAQHRPLWNTHCNVWDRGTAVFDWDVLYPVTQIRLKPVLYDTSDAIMQELTHQYVMINFVECFLKICTYSYGALLAIWRWEKVCWPWASYQHIPAPYSQSHACFMTHLLPLCTSLLINILWFNCVECFWKI